MSDDVWNEPRLLIDGQLVDAASGATYDNINPATEAVIGVTADAAAVDMDAAIAAARRAFDETTWSTDVAFRVRCLRQLDEALHKHAEELRGTVVAEVGAPVALTSGPQLDGPLDGVGWVTDLAEKYQWSHDLGEGEIFGIKSRHSYTREAAGVVGAITPWNFPVQINLAKVVPAMAAGCTVVLKPAPDTPWTGTLLGRIVAEETDIPAGVFNVIASSANEVGQQLCEDHRVDLISFTGSTATGKKIMIAGAGNLKKVFLELGGKSAAIMLDDADPGAALFMTAFAITTHAGQGCAITSRLLVPRSKWDASIEQLLGIMGSISYGDPTDPANMMGPLISARQRERVLGYIQKGVDEGATVALGGGVPAHLDTGFYVEPTVLIDVDPKATVAQEEIFGPVLVVLPFEDDDDAVRIANDSIYGLSGGVFSATDERATAVANRVRTGTMSINGGLYFGTEVPFGGYKQSGIGREMGQLGFEEYTEVKAFGHPA
jgi:aldehyde dehydrogenase (NAD+)